MKVVVIGATGTIGKALVTALSGRHEVVRRASGGPTEHLTPAEEAASQSVC
jgi:uncharacterized protein YbjT (DUF2867 family)